VLLDILTDDPAWAASSQQAAARAREEGRQATNPIVYAEVSTGSRICTTVFP